MGTNYYLHTKVCKCCGKSEDQVHIGKSSHGWPFYFRGYRNVFDTNAIPFPITCYHEWMKFISKEIKDGGMLKNEYGDPVSLDSFTRMLEVKQSETSGPEQSGYRRGSNPDEWTDSDGYHFCAREFS